LNSYAQRRAKVVRWLADSDLKLLVVSSEANLRYLIGFTGEELGLLGLDRAVLVTDRRYELEAQEADASEVIFAERGHLQQIAGYLNNLGSCRVGFEAEHLSFSGHEKLGELAGEAELVGTTDVVERHRTVKDNHEIAGIRAAASVASKAVDGALRELVVGISERELSVQLRQRIIEAGGDSVSFEPVVAFAEDSARAHATATDRKLARGDIVLIDLGAKVDGYCSDLTRTVVFAQPSEKFVEVYQTVRQAQQAAMEAIAPGVRACEVDQCARELINATEFVGSFGHSLGHGVGLEVHEQPRLSKTSEDLLAAGQVVTVEPGIYLAGWGGVRLEELVLITEQGGEPLTDAAYLEFVC